MKTNTAWLRSALVCYALVSSGCGDEPLPQDSNDSCGSGDLREKCSRLPPDRLSDASTELSLNCGDVQHEAFTLLRSGQSCESDSDCVVESVAARCLIAFACPVLLSRRADLASIREQALTLSLRHQQCSIGQGSACATASCARITQADIGCNTTSKQCEPKAAFTDAALPSPDAGSDASALTGELTLMDASSNTAAQP